MGCVPVSRNGRDAVAARTAIRRLQEGRVICIFPEGGLSNAGRPRLRPGKAGAALIALRSQAPVFPALISGGPQTSSLKGAWLRPSRVRVRFGRAIDLSVYQGRPLDRRLLEEVTRVLMGRIADLQATARPAGGRAPPELLQLVRKEAAMATATGTELTQRHCVPCEGGIPPLPPEKVKEYLTAVPNWRLARTGSASGASGGSRIS